jgi:hypothetical protein
MADLIPLWIWDAFRNSCVLCRHLLLSSSSNPNPIRMRPTPAACCMLLPPLSYNGTGSGAPAAFALEMTCYMFYLVCIREYFLVAIVGNDTQRRCEWASKGIAIGHGPRHLLFTIARLLLFSESFSQVSTSDELLSPSIGLHFSPRWEHAFGTTVRQEG